MDGGAIKMDEQLHGQAKEELEMSVELTRKSVNAEVDRNYMCSTR